MVAFQRYYIQRAFVRSVAFIRTADNIVSARVFQFLINVYKLNINDDNRFDDGYYQGVLIAARPKPTPPQKKINLLTQNVLSRLLMGCSRDDIAMLPSIYTDVRSILMVL